MHATSPRISTPCADLLRRALLASALAWVSHVSGAAAQTQAHPAPPASAAPADDGQWTMPAKNYAATRYSTLDQINGNNVKNSRVEFTFSTGTTHGEEAAPIVVDNTMYHRHALAELGLCARSDEARRADEVEVSSRTPNRRSAGRRLLRHRQSRRRSITDNKFFFNTLDGNTIALDAKTGKAAVDDASSPTSTRARASPMRAARGEGQGVGRRFGRRDSACAAGLQALDANTGKVVWSAYSTRGRTRTCLIGPDFHPFYPQDRGKDLGVSTWPPEAWKIGGGTELGLDGLRSRPQPALLRNRQSRPLEPGTAPRRQQMDRRAFSRATPIPARRNGATSTTRTTSTITTASTRSFCSTCRSMAKLRKVLLHPDRNGYLYMIDRTTGEILSADPYG